jgi:nucleolar pre-ribosomal-associated protein 1
MVKALRAPQEEFKRLPTHTSLLLAYAFRGIFYPSHFLYPHTSRHLLERPELDCNNVPMLLGMMFSSTDDWKKERFWMLRFIRDGLKSLQDWKLLRRRHVLELLTSQFEASEDVATRSLILEV